MKVVSKKSLNKSSMENLLTEIEILKTVRHPHIVQLKDFQVEKIDAKTSFTVMSVETPALVNVHSAVNHSYRKCSRRGSRAFFVIIVV